MTQSNSEYHDDLEDEKPSTIKEGFQRWLIVAGLLSTLLFGYLFVVLSDREKAKDAENVVEVTVPQQVQEGALGSQNPAVQKFQEGISQTNRTTSPVGEKVKDAPINSAFAPRKTASYESAMKPNEKLLDKKAPDESSQTPYQKFLETEQLRAYKSIAASDTIGDASGFYGDQKQQQSASQKSKAGATAVPRESLESKQSRIRGQIDAIAQYRQAIERGEVDPSAPPPPGLFSIGDNK